MRYQWRINQFLSALVHLSLSLYFFMKGDYLELSQFPYNSHPFPYNSHQSPLGTTRFLTSHLSLWVWCISVIWFGFVALHQLVVRDSWVSVMGWVRCFSRRMGCFDFVILVGLCFDFGGCDLILWFSGLLGLCCDLILARFQPSWWLWFDFCWVSTVVVVLVWFLLGFASGAVVGGDELEKLQPWRFRRRA